MNLAACGAARQREDFVMRLGCFLVTFAVLASLVLLPPKAKAFAMTSSTVTALAGGFLSACGLTPVVSGMGSSEEVNESVARLIQDFLNEEVGGISVADWALSFGEIGLAVKDKRIVIPKPFAEKLGEFARWVASKYSTKPGLLSDTALSLDVSDTMQQVLDRLTALEEGQSIALDVGATQSMEIQEILQGILDAILAGDLAASAEIVDTAEVPVDPEEPDPPVVPVVPSGLDKLGAALTSRFPFSIPWDVYKGVTLLAAPPKAPYFEVDFMAPIADRVGGWKGSTKIVLDFSEYEIIGQVCRWTSTIGFCLMLATGTKRLIWTA